VGDEVIRRVGGQLLLVLFLACCGAVAPSLPRRALAAEAAQTYTFAFKDAELSLVAEEILGRALGLSYTIDPSANAKISLRVERRLTRPQLLATFEAALATNDIAMVRQGDTLLLTARAKARAGTGVRATPEGRGLAGYEVVSVPLSFATPSEVAKAFQAVGSGNVVVYADDASNLLVLGGTPNELEAALQTLKVFDRGGLQGSRIRWFQMNHASATVLSTELSQVLQASGANGVSIVPLRRLNGVFAFARTDAVLDEVGRWVERLDIPSRDEAASLWVYRPRNVSADSLSRTLGMVLGGGSGGVSTAPQQPGAATAGGGQPIAPAAAAVSGTLGDDEVRVGVDQESNTLLISAPPAQRAQIQRILDEIDTTPSQILIEASILEVTLTDEFRMGVDWSALGAGGKLTVTSTNSASGSVAPTLPGFAISFIDDDIRAAIDVLGGKTDVEVISAPKIVALDNRPARLQVGDQVPIVVRSSQADSTNDAPVIATVEYRNTGIILEVTPRINGENRIMLTITQEVSSVSRTTTSGIDSPTIQQRRMESSLLIRDGGVVALGGLISSTRNKSDSGVPLLKDVPFLGSLFKTQGTDGRRTELIVLLKATIMRDDEGVERVMKDLLADMTEVQARGLLKP
jgi:general secretion pathway protein D